MGSGGEQRERWGSRIGLILAAAGNAIGIGNLLRFPGQAAQNGGGAFMVPYVICLVLFGLPMMWVAWTIGRYGGRFGHGTTPGMFDRLWRRPVSKYLGVLGVAIPLIFCLYYTYIESWCLGYSYFSLTGAYSSSPESTVDMASFFSEYLGEAPTSAYFSGLTPALVFLLITLAVNVFVLYRGVAKGIEVLAKIGVPLLFLFCLVLAVRVFTIDSRKAFLGLQFLWTPDFAALGQPKVWIAAAGQIFFTLSIGIGSLECYASYLRENDDITLTGLTTASTNEFVEVIFGSLIAIPAAAVFFGTSPETLKSVSNSTFGLGMISMPEVLRTMNVQVFGTIWFLLLFFAAFTSSVAVCQPVMAFLEDELKLKRGSAAAVVGLVWLLGSLPVMYFYKYGVLDEMDFWAGTIGLVVFSAIEIVIFAWVFKLKRGWDEMHRGADLRVPRIFYPIMLAVTPVCLLAIFGFWFVDAIQEGRLIPKPKVVVEVVGRDRYPGTFKARPDPRRAEVRKRVLAALPAGEGGTIAASVEIGPDGRTLAVSPAGGDAAALRGVPPDVIRDYLAGAGFGYSERLPGGGTGAAGKAVTVRVEITADGGADGERSIAYRIADAGMLPGRFQAPSLLAERTGEIRDLVEREARDLHVWAEVEIAADGRSVTTARVEGDPAAGELLTPEFVASYLTASGFGYSPPAAREGAAEGEPIKATVAIALLHTSPYIWLTRALITVITLAFAMCVRTVWRSRAKEEAAAASAGAAAA